MLYIQATSRSFEGTGIGLSLTKELVRLHGGHLTVTSRTQAESSDTPHGSIFTVTIPLGSAHIPRSSVDEGPGPLTLSQRTYARGIIDEASQLVYSDVNLATAN